jgi:enoyl-CoA hydratase/carnithine racemase
MIKRKGIGLVLDIFPAAELSVRVHEIATKMSKKGLLSLLAARRLVRAHCSDSKSKGYLLEREVFATLFASGEPKEGMKAFLEKREARFSWPGDHEIGAKI